MEWTGILKLLLAKDKPRKKKQKREGRRKKKIKREKNSPRVTRTNGFRNLYITSTKTISLDKPGRR